jgi:hypothetical protein
MVIIVPIRAAPERHDSPETPGEIVAGMRIDGLELPQCYPRQHCHQVYVAFHQSQEQRGPDGAEAQQESLPGTGVLGCQPEGRGVLVVDAVDGAVERPPVHGAMQPVVVCVFEEEEGDYLCGESAEVREGGGEAQAAEFHHWVEEDDEGELDDEVDEEDVFRAGPLLYCGRRRLLVLDLVFEEDAGEGVGDDPGETAAEVDDFVGEEGDYSCVS